MKRISLLLLLILIGSLGIAQPMYKRPNSVALSYDNVDMGQNISATYHYNPGKTWSMYLGMKYFIASKAFDNVQPSYVYFKQFRVTSFSQHFGVKAGVEKIFPVHNTNLGILVFYDVQYSRCAISAVDRVTYYPNGWKFTRSNYGPISCIGNTVGIGLRLKVADNVFLRVQGGFGYDSYSDKKIGMYTGGEVSKMESIGLEYTLSKLKNSNTEKTKERKTDNNPGRYSNSVALSYDDVYIGRNVNLVYHKRLPWRMNIYAGLKIFVKNMDYDNFISSHIYFKQFRTNKALYNLGPKLGLEKMIPLGNSGSDLLVSYDFQYTRGYIRHYVTHPDTTSLNLEQTLYGPVDAYSNTLSLGLRIPVAKNIRFRINGGLGTDYFNGPTVDKVHNIYWGGPEWKLSRMVSMGFEYGLR